MYLMTVQNQFWVERMLPEGAIKTMQPSIKDIQQSLQKLEIDRRRHEAEGRWDNKKNDEDGGEKHAPEEMIWY